MWADYDLRPRYIDMQCSDCDNCIVEEICPTNAFKNKQFNISKCFGCGMCANFCKNNAFDMNTGNVDLEIKGSQVNIPIICRQSDRLRGNKLSLKLKQLIKNKEFKL